MKHYNKTRFNAILGIISYVLLIGEIVAIVVITNSPLDSLIRGHYADIGRLLTVLLGTVLLYGSVQSALCITHRCFSQITITKLLFITGTSFVFPWLQLCSLLQRPLSATKVASFVR